jgi:ABC-type amino acid transport substrate-binding protein
LYEALKSGAIDAVLDDAPIATFFVQAIEGLRMDALPGTESTYAFVVRKTDRPLRERIDAVIEVLERDGELDRLRERWRLS